MKKYNIVLTYLEQRDPEKKMKRPTGIAVLNALKKNHPNLSPSTVRRHIKEYYAPKPKKNLIEIIKDLLADKSLEDRDKLVLIKDRISTAERSEAYKGFTTRAKRAH